MPAAINTLHTLFTVIAFGVLVGIGWALALMAVGWPASRITGAAAVVCVAILVLAWIVP